MTEDLINLLLQIDRDLDRIAKALETLVEIMAEEAEG